MSQVKSKQRVADHGEVFTPAWMVKAMLDLVKDETERIDSRFLEPACGSGSISGRTIIRHGSTSVGLENPRTIATSKHLTDHSGTSA
jgi:type I restriction-modification system DNA methylase subunit